MEKFRIDNIHELQKLAVYITKLLKIGDVITLSGELGVGKTALSKCIINNLLGEQNVTSPTFTLLQIYDNKMDQSIKIYHYDLYRLKKPDEIFELQFDEALDSGISLIEWPEIIKDFLPQKKFEIYMEYDTQCESKRTITILNNL